MKKQKNASAQRSNMKISTGLLIDAEFIEEIDSNMDHLGFWFTANLYCARVMNGGRIKGAASFPDRRWAILGILRHEVALLPSSLWSWDGEDLIISRYDNESEDAYAASINRAAAARAAKAAAEAKKNPAQIKSERGSGDESAKHNGNGEVRTGCGKLPNRERESMSNPSPERIAREQAELEAAKESNPF